MVKAADNGTTLPTGEAQLEQLSVVGSAAATVRAGVAPTPQSSTTLAIASIGGVPVLIVQHFVLISSAPQTPAPAPAVDRRALEAKFRALAARWRRETAHESSERRRINHPAHQAIVDLKWDVVPLLLRDIDQGIGDWFAALAMITGDNVSAETTTYQDAVSAWRDWGIRRGYLP